VRSLACKRTNHESHRVFATSCPRNLIDSDTAIVAFFPNQMCQQVSRTRQTQRMLRCKEKEREKGEERKGTRFDNRPCNQDCRRCREMFARKHGKRSVHRSRTGRTLSAIVCAIHCACAATDRSRGRVSKAYENNARRPLDGGEIDCESRFLRRAEASFEIASASKNSDRFSFRGNFPRAVLGDTYGRASLRQGPLEARCENF